MTFETSVKRMKTEQIIKVITETIIHKRYFPCMVYRGKLYKRDTTYAGHSDWENIEIIRKIWGEKFFCFIKKNNEKCGYP